MPKLYYTAEEVADQLGCKPQKVYAMARAKEIPHLRLGGPRSLVRFPIKEFEEWREENKEGV